MSFIDHAEPARLRTNAERVADLMADGAWHSNVELIAVGGQAGVRRLFDLQAEGRLAYEKKRIAGGLWTYRKVARPAPEQLPLIDKAVWG